VARKYLTPIDLTKLELQNAKIQNLATAPASPVTGQIYFDTVLGFLRVWDGTAWKNTSTGAQGTQGTQGATGETGAQGTQGTQGTAGAQGLDGANGAQGTQGTQGTEGTQGTQGTQGTLGSQGTVGAQGTQGTQGTEGAQGTEGQQGTQGTDGAQGTEGQQGTQGTVGAQGVQGTQGTQGVQGTLGAQGAQGTEGSQGTQGAEGAQGTQGTQGAEGAQGTEGTQGATGSFGGETHEYNYLTNTGETDPGSGNVKFDSTTFSSVTEMYIDDIDFNSLDISSFLETIDDSTSSIKGTIKVTDATDPLNYAFFQIVNAHTDQGTWYTVPVAYVSGTLTIVNNDNIYLTFARVGDKGDTGLQGTTGAQGVQGTVGSQGTQGTLGAQGTQGTEGAQGVEGQQGVQGTEGAQGTQGTEGAQGAQGTVGSQGTQGTVGSQGTQGTQGTDGIQGLDGAQGTEGAQGTQGTQGTDGIQGLDGAQGSQGTVGAQGTQGTQGVQGVQGVQGTQGATGTTDPITAGYALQKTGDEIKFDAFVASTGAKFEGAQFTTTLKAITPTANQDISLPDAAGTIALTSDITATIADTDDVPEGSGNLYFSVQRVNDALNTVVVDGTGIQTTYNGAQQTFTIAVDTAVIATKDYVDGVAQGLDVKESVRAATAAALPAYTYTSANGGTLTANANGALTIDTVAVEDNERVLVKNEAGGNRAYHGIYLVNHKGSGSTPWVLVRAEDANATGEVTAGLFTFVEEGGQADTGWVLSTNETITLNSTNLIFTQFSGAGAFTAGDGLTQTGTTFNVGAGTGISVAADTVAIDTSVVVRKFAATITPVNPFSATDFTITHNLATEDIQVKVYDTANKEEVVTDVDVTGINTVEIRFAVAPASGETYRVVVQA
jgi:hypothetical protein